MDASGLPSASNSQNVWKGHREYQRRESNDTKNSGLLSSAEQVLTRMLVLLKTERCVWQPALVCPKCHGIPLAPVTGECGHCWCRTCFVDAEWCGCGAPTPEDDFRNLLVGRLVEIMFPKESAAANEISRANRLLTLEDSATCERVCRDALNVDPRNLQLRLILAKIHLKAKNYKQAHEEVAAVMKIDPRMREAHYVRALVLKDQNRRLGALRSFFMAYLLSREISKVRHHIIELIELSLEKMKGIELIRKIMPKLRLVMQVCRSHKGESVLPPETVDASELECSVCLLVYRKPVVTECGHTFCRRCVLSCLRRYLGCPICNASLDGLRSCQAPKQTVFVAEITSRLPPELQRHAVERDGLLPMMVSKTCFPLVSCSLVISDARYKLMVRRCIESGSRRFGIVGVGQVPTKRFAECGTIMEIRECETRPNGNLLLLIVGLHRFHVVAYDNLDGYYVAKIEPLFDVAISGDGNEYLQVYSNLHTKALLWIQNMQDSARVELEISFGPFPDEELEWGQDGPSWVWWLLAALPHPIFFKMPSLVTREPIVRLRALVQMLDPGYLNPDHALTISPPVDQWLAGPINNSDAVDEMNQLLNVEFVDD